RLSVSDREALQKLPPAFLSEAARYRDMIAASRKRAGCDAEEHAAGIKVGSQLTTYRELPLPKTPATAAVTPKPLDALKLPQGFTLVRGERIGTSRAAISLSTAVDPMGEVGA